MRAWHLWLTWSLFLLLVFALLLGLNMRRGLNHDEHQFLASGKLVAQGLLPYRDFPYFHAPTLSLIYGLLFRWFDPLLLTARLLCVTCSWLALAVIGGQAWWLTPGLRWPWRLLWAMSVIVLLLAAPLFVYTSGRAWNHDLPVLLMVLAVVGYGRSLITTFQADTTTDNDEKDSTETGQERLSPCNDLQHEPRNRSLQDDMPRSRQGWQLNFSEIVKTEFTAYRALWGSGLLIGLAASVRLSFAFLAPAFLLAICWGLISTQRRQVAETQRATLQLCILAVLRFAVAFLIGFAPALWFLVQVPEQFLFGNIEYVRLNTLYYGNLAEAPLTMTLTGKFSYWVRLFTQEPGNWLLGASFVIALFIARSHAPRGNAVATLRVGSAPSPHPRPAWAPAPPLQQAQVTREGTVNPGVAFCLWLILSALLFMLIGALVATPSQAQYFYALFPLLALGMVYALASWPITAQRWGILGLSAVALTAGILAIPQYAPGFGDLLTPTAWYPHKLHRRAQMLATLVGQGTVLTLAPLYPLEGNVATYPALATGSFAWRVAPLVAAARRQQLGLFDPTQLAQRWQADPPRGVLVGSEEDDAEAEAALVTLAQAQGYVPVEVLDKQTLWLSPLAEWGGAIRLGAHTLPAAPLAPGEPFQVVFYLQNVQPLARNLNILVRVVGADGVELLRQEGWPWGSATSAWLPGEVWPDGHELVIPAAAQAGVYGVEVNFYDPGTFDPLGAAVTVGQIEVR